MPVSPLPSKNPRSLRGSNPLNALREFARFHHKHAADCAVEGKMQIDQFARTVRNYAVRVSEFVRKKPDGNVNALARAYWYAHYRR